MTSVARDVRRRSCADGLVFISYHIIVISSQYVGYGIPVGRLAKSMCVQIKFTHLLNEPVVVIIWSPIWLNANK